MEINIHQTGRKINLLSGVAMNSIYRIFLVVMLLALTTFSGFATADKLNDSSKIVCSSVDVIACQHGANCVNGSSQSFELPNFMFIDFKGKSISAKNHAGKEFISPIKNFEVTESQLIIQGVENHRGWNAAIDRASGRLSVSSVGNEVSIMIFGACTKI